MFEILLVSCLAGDPQDCGAGRIPVAGDVAACRERARTIAAGVPAHVLLQQYACVEAGTDPAVAVSEIAPGVFVHKGRHASDPSPENRGDLANITFIVGDEAVAVIDAGTHPSIGTAIRDAIRAETGLPIRWVILTHMHPDHVMGARPLLEDGGSAIGHRRLPEALSARIPNYVQSLRELGLTDLLESDAVVPDDSVEGTRRIDLGNRVLVLTAHATAHTDNDVTVLDENTRTLIAGDLLFLDHTPVVDGSLKGWIEVLDDLNAIDADRAVPGHGPVAVPWPAGAAPLGRYLATLAADTRAAIKSGRSMLDAIGEVAESERNRWLLFDTFNPRNATAAFQELEWE